MLSSFLERHGALPEQIPGKESLDALLAAMEEGLSGGGNIPMLPSFLRPEVIPPRGKRCCVLDAGGTNLRIAQARFDELGRCRILDQHRGPMPGSQGAVTGEAFFSGLAGQVRALGACDRIGFCFSYNVEMDADLDGKLVAWCKEVDVPDVVGRKVGASLAAALGYPCRIHVLNDSVAAMLGAAEPVRVGVILGTGVNVCYPEVCANIPKLGKRCRGSMIISTEVGEFSGFPKSTFDQAVIASTDDPALAQAEKQCSGGYLGATICRCWRQAAKEGLLPESFLEAGWSLAQISGYLAGEESGIPGSDAARELAGSQILRAARIAAILCAGPILRCSSAGETVPVAVEGSQYWRLTGFREAFHAELDSLLPDRKLRIVKTEDACLRGAALAAFGEPMGEE